MNIPGHNWIAVQLKPNAFRLAEAALLRQNLVVLCPKVRKTVRRFGKSRPESVPLFPGYLFVAVDLDRPQWLAVANTTGVSRIVTRRMGEPAPVPDTLMEGLISRCDTDGYLLPPQTLAPGDRVRLDAFANLVATVERIDAQRRVWVLLEILGGQREVQVTLSEVRAA